MSPTSASICPIPPSQHPPPPDVKANLANIRRLRMLSPPACSNIRRLTDSLHNCASTQIPVFVVNFNGSAMPPTPTCSRSFSTFSRSFRRETLRKRVSDDSRQLNVRRTTFFFDDLFSRRTSFFVFLGQFWSFYRQTDLTINFPAIFCFRCSYYEVCTTKNR